MTSVNNNPSEAGDVSQHWVDSNCSMQVVRTVLEFPYSKTYNIGEINRVIVDTGDTSTGSVRDASDIIPFSIYSMAGRV